MLPVPTDEELGLFVPDQAQKRFRIVYNVTTGETKQIELTLDEYRARHRSKIISQNEREARDLAEQQREADRSSALAKMRALGLTDAEIATL